jgi:hypothetical protein
VKIDSAWADRICPLRHLINTSTGATSGYSSMSHLGGAAVGVPRTIFSPA